MTCTYENLKFTRYWGLTGVSERLGQGSGVDSRVGLSDGKLVASGHWDSVTKVGIPAGCGCARGGAGCYTLPSAKYSAYAGASGLGLRPTPRLPPMCQSLSHPARTLNASAANHERGRKAAFNTITDYLRASLGGSLALLGTAATTVIRLLYVMQGWASSSNRLRS